MTDHHLHESHPEIVKRLKRAEGHLKSVIAMFQAEKPCLEIAQQLYAVEKAISQAKRTLIQDHIDHCLDEAAQHEGRAQKMAMDEFKAITRFL